MPNIHTLIEEANAQDPLMQHNFFVTLLGVGIIVPIMEEISNFIKTIMTEDLNSGKVNEIVTRFPPEPNAYLHIGHARAIVTNFELAKHFNGQTNLRFDDTNPVKEDVEFVDAIQKDLEWLGYEPRIVVYGSSYFERTFEKAILLIKKGLAFVCDLNQEQLSEDNVDANEEILVK